MSGGCNIAIILPKGCIYAIFGIFASKCRYYGKCDGRMCEIRELGVTFALNLKSTGVYGGVGVGGWDGCMLICVIRVWEKFFAYL